METKKEKEGSVSQHTIGEMRELYSLGESVENIAFHLGIELKIVKYYTGLEKNSPPKRYISDEKKRQETIKKMSETRGKSYKEILYLSFLLGKTTQESYESAFNTI